MKKVRGVVCDKVKVRGASEKFSPVNMLLGQFLVREGFPDKIK